MSEPRPPSKERTDDLAERVEELEQQVGAFNRDLTEMRDLIERLVDVLQDMNDDQNELAEQLQDDGPEPIDDHDREPRAFR